ncbi:MAG: hypothetical protein E2590_14655 [Chryseobacterium sp.]|uniref:hypothetical protein n=1 Tax=Epilithonimonas caeni TaxID=365343 RepID=UPI0004190721|nr:hypothetical protein [Epilithonimonas caeni]MPS74373.1 hypothetical protein [Chryseobacterium sp.]
MKISIETITYLFYWTIIFVVAGSMIVYGLGKPVQFQGFEKSADSNLSEGHQLMWSFYSYSLAYPIIIGILEILGGICLLLNRTRIFGCILLTIILSNIIIQDYIYDIKALNSAIYYQVLVFVILFFEYDKVRRIVQELFKTSETKRNFLLVLVAFVISILFKYIEAKI